MTLGAGDIGVEASELKEKLSSCVLIGISSKGCCLLGLVVFLYAFSSFKNNGRPVSKVAVQFTGNENVYITTEMVNKLLIQNQEQLYILPKDNLDLKEMEFLLESDDMIKSAQVYLTVNGEVRAKVEQKRPDCKGSCGGHILY